MWAGVHAVKAPRAIQSAFLLRQKEIKLAAPVAFIASNAVIGSAAVTGIHRANAYLQGRSHGLDEMELSDRTEILAEGGAAEEGIDHHGQNKVGNDDPGRPPWGVPEAEGFVGPDEQNEKSHGQPLASEGMRGHGNRPPPSLRASSLRSMNGQAKQKRLPATSRARTTKPRQ